MRLFVRVSLCPSAIFDRESSIYFSDFGTNKFDLKGMQMFPITFENVQKMFQKMFEFQKW